ncbi:MAG: hypothetical protein ACT4PP_12505 [Sporichthyaceae bacterium]
MLTSPIRASRFAASVVAFVMALALAACGSDDPDPVADVAGEAAAPADTAALPSEDELRALLPATIPYPDGTELDGTDADGDFSSELTCDKEEPEAPVVAGSSYDSDGPLIDLTIAAFPDAKAATAYVDQIVKVNSCGGFSDSDEAYKIIPEKTGSGYAFSVVGSGLPFDPKDIQTAYYLHLVQVGNRVASVSAYAPSADSAPTKNNREYFAFLLDDLAAKLK